MRTRTTILATLAVLILAGAQEAAAQVTTYERYIRYLPNDYPGGGTDYSGNVQGVAHDDAHWFFTQTEDIWKIHVCKDLEDVDENDADVLHRHANDYGFAFDHFGDPAWYGGHLVIPAYVQDVGNTAALVFFRGSDLTHVGTVSMAQWQGGDIAWCAVDGEGFIYTSVNAGPTYVGKYAFPWENLPDGPLSIDQVEQNPLRDNLGNPMTLLHMQGGALTPSGEILFTSNGYIDTDPDEGGLSSFNTSTWRRIDKSTIGSGLFNYEWHPEGLRDQEPEGLTIWNLDGGCAPGIDGQLHAVLLDNEVSDQIYFKHYSGVLWVDRAYAGAEQFGTFDQPFRTVTSARNFAWHGTEIAVRAGSYPEPVVLDKFFRLRASGGSAVVGQ